MKYFIRTFTKLRTPKESAENVRYKYETYSDLLLTYI